MARRFYSFLTVLILSSYSSITKAQSNDHIFPASVVAKPYIDFDSKGFLINGKRTFLVSAGLEYARIPHQLWYDRLLRIKRAGFNCIEIYTMWNFHEPHEGKFDFTGDHDLGAFLKIVKDLGLYAIVRVGPYYCAEWDLGGYPIWLKFKKGVSVREDNKPFEQYVNRFFDHLLPIVFKNQINNGGSVILVQLENEHPKSWGDIVVDGYFKSLQIKALQLGLQVPYFFSGLHHGSDPAGDDKLDDEKRPNPWMSTEFWSVWYSQYGAKPGDADLYDRRTWKIISRGGNGYNYYMAHGGSNFGYTNNDEDAASYDYGSAIGQTGDLRPIYYAFKRAAWFARSFEDVLENSTDATPAYSHVATDAEIKVNARTSPSGDVIYLDNPGKKEEITALNINGAEDLTAGKKLTIKPGEIYPLIHNFKLNAEVTLNWALTRVFAIVKQGNTTTVIVDAEEKSPVLLQFGAKGGATTQSSEVKINNGVATINENMLSGYKPIVYTFKAGNQTIRVLAMNRKQTDRTWITEIAGKNYIISGVDYVGDATIKDNQLHIITETPQNQNGQQVATLYTADSTIPFSAGAVSDNKSVANIALNNWEYKSGTTAAAINANTTGWLKSQDAQPMGADNDITADAWYRTKVNAPSDGKYTLQIKGNGRGQIFVDGQSTVTWQLHKNEVSFNLKKGKHILAIFTAHDGRDKLVSYIGPIDKIDNKGVFGTALIKKGGPFISGLNDWYFAKASQKSDIKAGPITDASAYKKYKIGDDAFDRKEGYGWFKTTIPQQAAGTTKLTLSFRSVDENATVFINGKEVAHHEGWDQPFEVVINDAQALKAPINLSVFVENHSNEGGIDQSVKINAIGDATPVTGWELKGGPGNLNDAKGWGKLTQAKANNGPVFYRTTFNVSPVKGRTLIWRFDPEGLGHGSVWVNGHNLGRYPEKLDMKSLYIPECWLNAGANHLVVYDEDGKPIDKTKVVTEPDANRSVTTISAKMN